MTTAQHTAPLGAVTILRVVDYFSTLANQVIARREKRITRKALARLSDQHLNDIGLTREFVDNL